MNKYNPLGFKIGELSKLIKETIEKKAQKEGLSSTQMKIFKMLSINRSKEITQNDICNFTKFKASTISVALQQMEDEGYIERIKSNEDARKTIIKLTQKGFEKDKDIINIFDNLESSIIKNLNDDEILLLNILLDKMRDNVREEKNKTC